MMVYRMMSDEKTVLKEAKLLVKLYKLYSIDIEY
jgi:hypothetical protein